MPTTYKPPVKPVSHSDTNHSPGISLLLFFCLADDILTEPLANEVTSASTLVDNIAATGTFTFGEGKGFSTIRCAKAPELSTKTGQNGAYETEFDLYFMNSEEAEGFRHTYKTAQLSLVATDANLKKKRIGTKFFPAMMDNSESKSSDGSLTVKMKVPFVGVNTLPAAIVIPQAGA